VLEVTSHGLAQHRVTACDFDVAVVTNITHEHLDYHGTPEAYRAAKARLFESLSSAALKPGQLKTAILNRDDSSYTFLRARLAGQGAGVRIFDYAVMAEADVSARNVEHRPGETRFDLVTGRGRLAVSTPLVGRFNVENCLAASAVALLGLDLPPQAVAAGIAAVRGVPGRMERIDLGQDFTALVDFAHTPNALDRALRTARQLASGRVIAVFGSAGLRDHQKRRLMPQASAALADITILTTEDPRTEPLEGILAEMADACREAGGVEGVSFWRVPDRGEALRLAVALAQPGDLVIACGKGHEQSMCFGAVEFPWDDRLALRAALAERLGLPGPAMPRLPTAEA
jgi:UDP-N-acetylmuramoyl-L-alanyl-D-glutamate--2,6-diaminopimelate ligase